MLMLAAARCLLLRVTDMYTLCWPTLVRREGRPNVTKHASCYNVNGGAHGVDAVANGLEYLKAHQIEQLFELY